MNDGDRDDEVDALPGRRRRFWSSGPDRRRSERRHAERRADDRLSDAETDSMFSVLVSSDSQFDETGDLSSGTLDGVGSPGPRADQRDRSTRSSATVPTATPKGQRARWEDSDTLQRLYAKFVGARAIVGLLLVAALVLAVLVVAPVPLPTMLVAIAYGTQAIVLWLLPRLRGTTAMGPSLTRQQWLATIGIDLAAFSLMHWMQPVHSFNFVILLLMPLLMGGALASRRASLAGAAAVVLMLLAASWREAAEGRGGAVLWMQMGMVGAGLFSITLLAGEMAARLAREARVARGGIEMARQQAQLNRLVIEEMTRGRAGRRQAPARARCEPRCSAAAGAPGVVPAGAVPADE